MAIASRPSSRNMSLRRRKPMPGVAALCCTRKVASASMWLLPPGCAFPTGRSRIPSSHVLALAPHHTYYHSGISEILTLDPTIRQNPQALLQLCKGALAIGMREFTANVADSDLVRVTGYMIRKSDVARFAEEGSRLADHLSRCRGE